MIAVYGNSGFWAWLRYWYLDSADFVTLMLMDKGYYDYDYEKPKEKKARNISKGSDPDKLKAKLARLGIGTAPQHFTAEEMQRIAMQEARERKNKQ